MFRYTTAIDKIRQLTKRKKVIQGGSSASKTYGILAVLINEAASKPLTEISVVSESVPHLKKGALKDFIKIMKWTNRWNESRYNATERKYEFANGSYVEFFSPESILGARRNILYINEANHITYEDYHQLAVRTSGDIFIDFNPAGEFWAHTEVLTEQDSELLILTYKDNEALPPNVISDFETARIKAAKEQREGINGYWTNWCRVYIDGEIGSLQGTIFQFELVDDLPRNEKGEVISQRIAYGFDWGFSNDPNALIDVHRFNGALYLDQLIYQTGMTNADTVMRMNELGISKRDDIIADSSEPKSIEDFKRAGYYNTKPARKGEDSIRNSIDTLQQHPIFITKRSVELIKEFRMYRWETGKDGKSTGKPIDAFNHGIDAVRYVALNKINKGGGKFNYSFG